MKRAKITETDWFTDEVVFEEIIEITDEEFDSLMDALNPDLLLAHVAKCVGVMTPTDDTKFIPVYKIGDFKLSMQIAYYLWSNRLEEGRRNDNSPITQDEYDRIMKHGENTILDVKMTYKDTVIIKATQMEIFFIFQEIYRLFNCTC